MGQYLADVAIHITERLDDPGIVALEEALCARDGVHSARHRMGHNQVMLVHFDPDELNSVDLLQPMTSQGLHARLIGL